jgi:hypothetical protein
MAFRLIQLETAAAERLVTMREDSGLAARLTRASSADLDTVATNEDVSKKARRFCGSKLTNIRWLVALVSALWLARGFTQPLPEQAAMGQAASPGPASAAAATPPMGWNSYDAYGTTITEAQFRANALELSQDFSGYGWRYAVIDAEWFVLNPTPSGNSKQSVFALDGYGRYVPAPNRFPSATGGAGFKPLADYVHSLGLRFGIHILRGIPKEAVRRNLPIAGSAFHAAEAADMAGICPWSPDNYGVDASKPAGQAYYNSIAALYTAWGVDFIKADCIGSHPYSSDEIRMLSTALHGRDIVLSLSPGPSPQEALSELRQHANLWRISEDVWDLWHSETTYPQGLRDQFARSARWAPLAEPGHWPDADMLAIGFLGPAPGWGQPRYTRLTRAEQRAYLTLWCISRSPLMMGGNLTRMDDWTRALLTNREVLAVDQQATDARQVLEADGFSVWRSRPDTGDGEYLAIFNLESTARTLDLPWEKVGLTAAGYRLRDLWTAQDLGAAARLRVELPGHGAALYRALAQ